MKSQNESDTQSTHRGQGRKTRLLIALSLVAIAILLVVFIRLAVPNTIRLLTGPKESTFYQDGLRYKEVLEQRGLNVVVVETDGSLENIKRLLEADELTVAFADAIETLRDGTSGSVGKVESLGSIYLQPLWFFSKKGSGIDGLEDLRGKQIAPGRKGSGSRLLAKFLLESAGIQNEVDVLTVDNTELDDALGALQADRIAAVVASGEPDSPLIDSLLRAPSIAPWTTERGEAIALRYPFLTRVRYPEGAHDLMKSIPDRDLVLLASGTELLVTAPFPPAISDLLLDAAREIHGSPTLFSSAGQFPDPDMASLPLSKAARHYYSEGPSKLGKILPFRLATLLDRFMGLVVGAATAAVAIFSLLPRILSLRFSKTVRGAYRRLEAVEKALTKGGDRRALLVELDNLEDLTANLRVPMSSLETTWFELRQNIHDVRDRVELLDS